MRYFIIVLIMAHPLIAEEMSNKTEIDDRSVYNEPSYRILQRQTMIDSSWKASLTFQQHEVIAYSPIADGIVIVNFWFHRVRSSQCFDTVGWTLDILMYNIIMESVRSVPFDTLRTGSKLETIYLRLLRLDCVESRNDMKGVISLFREARIPIP